MPVTEIRRIKSFGELSKAIEKNAAAIVEAVEHLDTARIKALLEELRHLEDDIYYKLMNDGSMPFSEKDILRARLAQLQHILLAEERDLQTRHLEKIKELAGKEKKIATEIEAGFALEAAEEKSEGGWGELFEKLETGDIIGNSVKDFSAKWGKAAAVFMIATGSKFCHVGVIDVGKGWLWGRKIYVIHAGEVMKREPIKDFIEHHGGEIAVYRYTHGMADEQKKALIEKARSWVEKGIRYDYGLAPGEGSLYCSELVDEAYKAAGIALTDRYWSVYAFQERVRNYFERGIYAKFGLKFNSAEEALNAFMGKEGFYKTLDPAKVDRFRKSIITPGDIIKNSNTTKIFDNISSPFG